MSTPPFVDLPACSAIERWPVRGSRLAVMHAGMQECDAWVVLVPGFTGSKEDFIAVLPLLADAGLGALCFDQRGQFESDAPTDPGGYALESLGRDLADVVDQARRRFALASAPHLVGHSFGGLVAQQALIDGLHVTSFVALCSGPAALPPERQAGLDDLVEALGRSDLATIWAIMRETDVAAGTPPPAPEIADFLRARWLANDPLCLTSMGRLLMTQPDLTPDMVRCLLAGPPATVMWGEHDDAWPVSRQMEMALAWGARALQLDGLGHSPNAEDPAALVEALLRDW